jgi:hypothetical protein
VPFVVTWGQSQDDEHGQSWDDLAWLHPEAVVLRTDPWSLHHIAGYCTCHRYLLGKPYFEDLRLDKIFGYLLDVAPDI